MRPDTPPERQSWPLPALITLSAAVCLSVTTEMLPTGLLPAMSRDLQVTPARLGLLVTAYALMVALFAAPLGLATARLPRRGLISATLTGYGLSNAVMAISTNYPMALAARLVGGVTHGIFWAMLAGYAARMVSPSRVGRAVAITSAGGTVAMLVGVPAGTALGVAIGWRLAFAVLAGLSLVLVLVGRRLLPDLSGSSASAPIRMSQVIRMPGLPAIIGTTATTMLGFFAFFTYVAPFLQHAGLSEAAVGPALLAYGLVGAIGLTLAGLFVDRRPHAAMVVALAALTAALTVLALPGNSIAVAVVATASTGFALGALPIFLQAATLRAAPGAADAASALNASAFNVGIGGGALLGAVTIDGWGAAALPAVAAVLALFGLLTVAVGRRTPAPVTS
jgi:DHA1 family inner membrane transport protein